MRLGKGVATLGFAGCRRAARASVAILGLMIPVSTAFAVPADGFTEPYRTIDVAAAETGIVAAIEVREGDTVQQGDVLAVLDHEVLSALMAIAEQAMQSRGALDAARAEYGLKQRRLDKLEMLRSKGHARQEEVERARADLAIAEAQQRSAQEDLLIRKLEYQKIRAQLERRKIRAPVGGVVIKVHKELGGFVAPNDPAVATLVQLDPLRATFSLTRDQANQLAVDQQVTLWSYPASGETSGAAEAMEGTVEFVAPVTDAESGTVRVKIRIDNPENRHRAGERCTLQESVDRRQAAK